MSRLMLINDQMDFVSFNLGGNKDPYYILESIYLQPLVTEHSTEAEKKSQMEGSLINIFLENTKIIKIHTLHTVNELEAAIDHTNTIVNLREDDSLTKRFNAYKESVYAHLDAHIKHKEKQSAASLEELTKEHNKFLAKLENTTPLDIAKDRLQGIKKSHLLTRKNNRVF